MPSEISMNASQEPPAEGVDADAWSTWVMHGRYGADGDESAHVQAEIRIYAQRLLDGLPLAPGMRLLDLGTGDGLVPALALERYGPGIALDLVDVSPQLIAVARERLAAQHDSSRDRYQVGSAERLDFAEDGSVDAVSSRACMAYVEDKPAAFGEIFRVLKPGGRVAMVEPIFRDDALVANTLRTQIESLRANGESPEPRLLLSHKLMAAQFPDNFPDIMRDARCRFSERDLYHWAQAAGLVDIQVRLELNQLARRPQSWANFLATPVHPLCPSPGEILRTQFTPQEAEALEKLIRPELEAGLGVREERIVYLRARKPL